jgi:hypothetical protein
VSDRKYLGGIVVFAAALAYFRLFLGYGMSMADEGTILAQIERLADGETLYTDFNVGYTPGFYYLHAWVMRVFGHSVIPIRWLLAITNALTTALVYLTALKVSRSVWMGAAAAFLYVAALPVHAGLIRFGTTRSSGWPVCWPCCGSTTSRILGGWPWPVCWPDSISLSSRMSACSISQRRRWLCSR